MLPRTSPVRSKGSAQSTLLLKCALNGNRSLVFSFFAKGGDAFREQGYFSWDLGSWEADRILFYNPKLRGF